MTATVATPPIGTGSGGGSSEARDELLSAMTATAIADFQRVRHDAASRIAR
jgi:hypothetical protein